MIIKEVVWLRQFVEKIERKHHVSQEEVEQLFLNRPTFQFAEKGDVPREDLYRAIGQTDAGRYLIVFLIHKQGGRALVISLVMPLEVSEDIMPRKTKKQSQLENGIPYPNISLLLRKLPSFGTRTTVLTMTNILLTLTSKSI
jgi:uncharacterized DUF497 family protein